MLLVLLLCIIITKINGDYLQASHGLFFLCLHKVYLVNILPSVISCEYKVSNTPNFKYSLLEYQHINTVPKP